MKQVLKQNQGMKGICEKLWLVESAGKKFTLSSLLRTSRY
jgi:hypothetical protein